MSLPLLSYSYSFLASANAIDVALTNKTVPIYKKVNKLAIFELKIFLFFSHISFYFLFYAYTS